MSEKYYVLMLTDPATPGFCSFNKMYVGTEETINTVANNLEKAGHYPETVSALRNYFKGNHSAEHSVAYQRQKILVPVKIESERKISFDSKKWTHINIWGFPYEMKCDSAIIHQVQKIQSYQITDAHVCIGVITQNNWYLPVFVKSFLPPECFDARFPMSWDSSSSRLLL